jgi:hypothetical protein
MVEYILLPSLVSLSKQRRCHAMGATAASQELISLYLQDIDTMLS